MTSQIYNLMLIFTTGVFWILVAIASIRGKRVIKNTILVLNLVNLAIIADGFVRLGGLGNQYLLLAIGGIIIVNALLIYKRGIEYSVNTENPSLLTRSIFDAIAQVEGVKAEEFREKDKTKFLIPNGRNYIALTTKENWITGKQNYKITFLKWLDFGSRRDILRIIEDSLADQEQYKSISIKNILSIVGAIIVIMASSWGISYSIMEPHTIRVVSTEQIPTQIYEVNTQQLYTDPKLMENFHFVMDTSRAVGLKNKEITHEGVAQETYIRLDYGYKGRTLYYGENRMFLYIKHSEIGEISPLHWVCWKIYSLYNKSGGMYYTVVYMRTDDSNALLKEVFNSF